MEERRNEEERSAKEKKTSAVFKVLVVALMLVIIVILLLLLLRYCGTDGAGQAADAGIPRSVAARLGQLEGKTEAEIQAELDRVIEEGMFNISINADPVFANGEAEGTLEIENTPNNLYAMRVEIRIDKTGELVYDSGLIDPDYHVQRDRLLTALPAGDYPASVTFYAYDMETQEEMGAVSTRITIHILY